MTFWLVNLILFIQPLLSWDDSLVIYFPRLGRVIDADTLGSVEWLYELDGVSYLWDDSSRIINIFPIPEGISCAEAKTITEKPETTEREPKEITDVSYYWVDDSAYDPACYEGPWEELEAILEDLAPEFLYKVRDSLCRDPAYEENPELQVYWVRECAVSGTLFWGQPPVFKSRSDDYEVQAPPASRAVKEYFVKEAGLRSVPLDRLGIEGILFIWSQPPDYFYVLEEN